MRTINEASRLMRFTLHRLRAELTYFTLSQVVTWRICSAWVRTACAHPTGLRLAIWVAMLLMPAPLLAGNNEPVITLETGEGEAGCWISYKLEVFKDGKVHWYGLSYVHVKGHRYKRIGKRKVAALLKKFDEAKFFEITNRFAEREAILAKIKTPGFVLPPKGSPELARMERAFVIVTDVPVFNITLNTGGRKKTISYYGGGEEGELERATWQAVPGSKDWLLPAHDPWRSHCREDH